MIMLIVIAIAAAAGIWFWFFYLDHRTPQQVMDAEDGTDPMKRWARVAYVGVNGKFDPARFGQQACRDTLKRDWDIADAARLQAQDQELAQAPSGNVAWDHIRRLLLGRLGVGAAFVDEGYFTRVATSAKQALTSTYSSWDSMLADYREGLVAWSNGDQARLESWDFNVESVSKPLQSVVSFK